MCPGIAPLSVTITSRNAVQSTLDTVDVQAWLLRCRYKKQSIKLWYKHGWSLLTISYTFSVQKHIIIMYETYMIVISTREFLWVLINTHLLTLEECMNEHISGLTTESYLYNYEINALDV